MTDNLNPELTATPESTEESLQTRANTIVRAADHATPLELSRVTIHYGGDKGGAEEVDVVDDFNLTLHMRRDALCRGTKRLR